MYLPPTHCRSTSLPRQCAKMDPSELPPPRVPEVLPPAPSQLLAAKRCREPEEAPDRKAPKSDAAPWDGPSLDEMRHSLRDFASARDWDQFHTPRNLALAMVGEVGELCECFQWKGEVSNGLPGWEEKDRTHLGEEMADVLMYLVRLADKCEIDLPAVAARKLKRNAEKYPADLVRARSRHTRRRPDASHAGVPLLVAHTGARQLEEVHRVPARHLRGARERSPCSPMRSTHLNAPSAPLYLQPSEERTTRQHPRVNTPTACDSSRHRTVLSATASARTRLCFSIGV